MMYTESKRNTHFIIIVLWYDVLCHCKKHNGCFNHYIVIQVVCCILKLNIFCFDYCCSNSMEFKFDCLSNIHIFISLKKSLLLSTFCKQFTS